MKKRDILIVGWLSLENWHYWVSTFKISLNLNAMNISGSRPVYCQNIGPLVRGGPTGFEENFWNNKTVIEQPSNCIH